MLLPEEKPKRVPISVPEVKDLLDKLDPEKADQIQKRTQDYAMKFSKVSAKEARELRRKLMKEGGLTEEEAIEVVNIMPKSLEELRAFTAGWKKLYPTEQIQRILALLREH